MIERRILFIVEGEQDELKFLKRMIKTCYPSIKHEFYSYKTTLHTLAQVLEKDYPSFEEDNIDISLVKDVFPLLFLPNSNVMGFISITSSELKAL